MDLITRPELQQLKLLIMPGLVSFAAGLVGEAVLMILNTITYQLKPTTLLLFVTKVNDMDYWGECISEAFEDAGIKATNEQISTVSGWVEGAHENYGMAFGHDCIPNPLVLENEKLLKEIIEERNKVTCEICAGTGETVSHGPCHSAYSQCYMCRGNGRV